MGINRESDGEPLLVARRRHDWVYYTCWGAAFFVVLTIIFTMCGRSTDQPAITTQQLKLEQLVEARKFLNTQPEDSKLQQGFEDIRGVITRVEHRDYRTGRDKVVIILMTVSSQHELAVTGWRDGEKPRFGVGDYITVNATNRGPSDPNAVSKGTITVLQKGAVA